MSSVKYIIWCTQLTVVNKNGRRPISKDQQRRRTRIGTFIQQSLYRIGRFDMGRECPAVRFWNQVAHYVQKILYHYGVTKYEVGRMDR